MISQGRRSASSTLVRRCTRAGSSGALRKTGTTTLIEGISSGRSPFVMSCTADDTKSGSAAGKHYRYARKACERVEYPERQRDEQGLRRGQAQRHREHDDRGLAHAPAVDGRSEEHTSELQSPCNLV